MPTSLPPALHHPLLWQGSRRPTRLPVLPTGHERLDRVLPGGGWPLGALTELLAARDGVGELSLLLPTLARVSREGGWAVFVDPPWTPYPPAIHGQGMALERLLVVSTRDAGESLWACEQALRGVRGGVVLSWLRGTRHRADFTHLRRLQLAARSGHKGAFLFRPAGVAGQATPAALRLHLDADDEALHLTLLKGRGTRPGQRVRLPRQHAETPRASSRDAILPGRGRAPGRAGQDPAAGDAATPSAPTVGHA